MIRGLSKITFQFTASHCGIERNEMADLEADRALEKCAMEQSKTAIPLAAIKAKIKRHCKTNWLNQLDHNNARYTAAGPRPTNLTKLCKELTRADMVLSAQLRTGECKLMGRLRHRLADTCSSLCRWCNIVDETVIHVFVECSNPNLVSLRSHMKIHDASVLYDNPSLSVTFAKTAITFLPNT
jgi:hypothetical protein